MDQIEKAMGAVSVNHAADKKRMQDAMTWAKIIKGGRGIILRSESEGPLFDPRFDPLQDVLKGPT